MAPVKYQSNLQPAVIVYFFYWSRERTTGGHLPSQKNRMVTLAGAAEWENEARSSSGLQLLHAFQTESGLSH